VPASTGPRGAKAAAVRAPSCAADVVVVGAGLAGLTAAAALWTAGRDVVVLEARDRVGGRTFSVPARLLGDGERVDLGAQWVGRQQQRVGALADALGVERIATYDLGDSLFVLDGDRRRSSTALPLDGDAAGDYASALRELEQLVAAIDVQEPWRTPGAAELDAQTLDTWLRATTTTQAARTTLSSATSGLLATEPATVSLLHAAFYLAAGHGFDVLMRTEGGAQEARLRGGAMTLAERLRDVLGDHVRLGSPVTGIDRRADPLVVETATGSVLARSAVIAVPPALAQRIGHEPPLPSGRALLEQRLPQASVIKVFAFFADPFWRRDGLSGATWTPEGQVPFTYDFGPEDGRLGVLVGLIDGDAALRLSPLPAPARRRAVLEALVALFGPAAAEPLEYVEHDWMADPWSRGAYAGFAPPGTLSRLGDRLRAPAGRVSFAGTESAAEGYGYMEGAVASGLRVACELLDAPDADVAERRLIDAIGRAYREGAAPA